MAITFRCSACAAVAWTGGGVTAEGDYIDLPIGAINLPDGSTITITAQDIWSGFADTSCPRGGRGCPNTSAAWQTRLAQQPATAASVQQIRETLDFLRPIAERAEVEHQQLRDADTALTARVAALEARRPTTRISPPITIPATLTDTTRDLSVTWSPPMPSSTYEITINEPRFAVTVKSQSSTGCALILRTIVAVPATPITVVAAGWA